MTSCTTDALIRWRREILAGTRVGPPRQILSGAAIDEQSYGQCRRTRLTESVCVIPGDAADITNTTMIRAVVANGRYFDRAALDSLLAEVQAKTAKTP